MLETINSQYKSVKTLLHQSDIAYFYRNGYSKDIIDSIFDIVKKTKIDKQVVGVLLKLNYDVNRVLKQMIVDETKFLDDAVQNGICKQHKILMTERLYCVLNGIHAIPLCRVCGNPLTNFIINRTNDIHRVVCSKICSNRDAEKIEKRVIKYVSRSPEEKLKTKLQTQHTIEQKFGNKCFMKTEYFKKKQLEYIIENGGECNVSQIKAVRYKVDETNIDRYGNRCNLANEDQLELKKQTYIDHYGVDHPMKSSQFIEEWSSKFFEEHCVHWPFQLQSCKDNTKLRFLEFKKQRIKENPYVIPLFDIDSHASFEMFGEQYWWQCLECGHVFASHIIGFPNQNGRVTQCPFCKKDYRSNHSLPEYHIVKFLRQQFPGMQIIHNDNKVNRHIIPPRELDIWIPDKKIAIEYDGVFWHSKEFIDKYKDATQYYRLLEKTKLCEQKGIHLIHVYESEWIYHQDDIKQLLIQLISGDIVFPNTDIILLPYDKYSSFIKINGYEFKDITHPELVCHYGIKKKLYHVYDCGKLVFKRIK